MITPAPPMTEERTAWIASLEKKSKVLRIFHDSYRIDYIKSVNADRSKFTVQGAYTAYDTNGLSHDGGHIEPYDETRIAELKALQAISSRWHKVDKFIHIARDNGDMVTLAALEKLLKIRRPKDE